MNRETSTYRLPDQRLVQVYEDVARGAATVTFQLVDRSIVNATRVTPVPAQARRLALARQILTTVNEWADEGANETQLLNCILDLLAEQVLDQSIIERLAQVYTVDTDQAALIALVRDAQQDVERVR